jgi:diguanylate cyclase (GGDEF)-like protein
LLAGSSLRAQEYSFRNFGNAEGLENLAIRQIYQDRVGFLWASTETGIFRYDGERFEGFGPAQGLPHNDEAALGDAPDGSLLAGGDFGLYRLRGNRFQKIDGPFKTVDWRQGIEADGKGHTFVGTDAGLIELSGAPGQSGFSIHKIRLAPGIVEPGAHGVLVDGDSVWYGCDHQLCHLTQNEIETFGRASGLPYSAVAGIQKDRQGNLFVQAGNGAVFEMEAEKAHFRAVSPPILDHPVSGLSVDSGGRILLACPDALFIEEGNGWRKVSRPAGLHGAPSTAFEDRQHALWIGLDGQGLTEWRGYREWENYSTAGSLSNDLIYAVLAQPDGTVWVGSDGGLLRGKQAASGMEWNRIAALQNVMIHAASPASDGSLWIGALTRGVAHFVPSTGAIQWFAESQGLSNKMINAVCFDRKRRLWAATDGGLFFSPVPYTQFFRVPDVPPTRVWTVVEGSDGVLWVGGVDGLFSYAGGQWKSYKPANGLSHQQILALGAGPDGTVWVGYDFAGGIDHVRLQSGGIVVDRDVQRRSTKGLIYFLAFDAAGRLWAGTEHGVDVWDGARWSHYDTGDGLVWNDCNLHAFAAQRDGAVWIGTSGGLSRFTPETRRTPIAPLDVVFTQLTMGRSDVSGQINPSFGPHSDSLVVRYSALNASRENGVLFRYRLKGTDSKWTETDQRELQFAELAPGAYLLEVEARDGDSAWRGAGTKFAFTILPPWYRTWWFLLLSFLCPLSAVGIFLRWRMEELHRRERELARLMKAHEEIRNLAFYDTLTGLPNRRMLLDRLRQTLAGSARTGRLQALLFADLDNFKTLNDTLGHQAGDLLLQEVAIRLAANVREVDTVARIGGDEFIVMIDELSEVPEVAAAQAEIIAEKVLEAVGQPYCLEGRECNSTSSIGITIFGTGEESTDEVLQQAEIALYQAKGAGRNTVRFFAPALQAAVNARASMEEDMRSGIKDDQFVLYYQPQVERGMVIGAEALIRWNHPTRGLLQPGEFISMAEESGLILPLGDWVLNATCRQIAAWAINGPGHITVSANISARQFRQPEFVDFVLATLETTGANPESLKLELTESMLLDDVDEVVAKMTELKAHGLKFSLDDFGTGYSSLSYLRRLPLDELKIDRSFVWDAMRDAGGSAVVQAILSLGHAMDLSVVAEGVETDEQLAFLANLGCHTIQGYLFSRPVPAAEFEKLLDGQILIAQSTFW